LVELLLLSARGEPMPESVAFKDESAMVVVLASNGYPGSYPKGEVITEPETPIADTFLIHAGTQEKNGQIVTAGGRVLGAVGTGSTLAEAKNKAYKLVEAVSFESKYFRSDIGHREFSRT
jgi:phosphoribosylamine-glycine ligase